MKILTHLKNNILILGCVVGAIICYLAVAKISVETIISKSSDGETVVTMGPGVISVMNFFENAEPPVMGNDRYKYQISVIEYRDSKGKTLSRYEPRFAPHNIAQAYWTEKFVLISSELNGECPDFRAFDRATGNRIEGYPESLLSLPSSVQLAFDPCGMGMTDRLKKN